MSEKDLVWFIGGTVLPSAAVAWLATWIMRFVAPRLNLVDKPNARKVHSVPMPMGGGVAIFLGVTLPFLAGKLLLSHVASMSDSERAQLLPSMVLPHLDGLSSRMGDLWFLLGCGGVLMLLGLIDDRFSLPWQPRFAIQFLVAILCVQQGYQLTAFIKVPYLGSFVSFTLSTLWIVALINSFNMLDNMDGLSSGVAAIAGGMLAWVLLVAPDPLTRQPQLFVAGVLLVLVGSLLGFLWHNRSPARIFMGDAGSYFVGFCIAAMTMKATYTSYDSKTPHAVLAPFFVLVVPLYDMATVLWIRLREGRSFFQADKNHFSHRLVDLGFSKPWAVRTIYLTTATCGLGALLLHRVDLFGAGIIVLMILSVLLLIAILESTARRKLNGSKSNGGGGQS